MKNTILLLFFPFLLSAQEVTRDTSYLTNSGGNFFNVNRIEYENGAYSETSTMIGDTLAVLSLYANKISSEANQYASVPTLTKQDKQALRLYSKLQWYDFSTYRFKGGGKRAVWIAYAAVGILHGGREAYHAEPTVFEKRFNARPQSFFGSEQWKRNYFDRDPDNGHKPNLFNPVRDYYHFAGAATKTVWIGGAFTIGMSKQPMKYKLLDLLIGTLITSGSASLTYNILR